MLFDRSYSNASCSPVAAGRRPGLEALKYTHRYGIFIVILLFHRIKVLHVRLSYYFAILKYYMAGGRTGLEGGRRY